MSTFLYALLVVAAVMLAMAAGHLLGGRRLRGSCGGVTDCSCSLLERLTCSQRPPADEPQSARAVLMIRPVQFGANPQTAASNTFQQQTAAGQDLQPAALREFEGLARALREAGVEVVIFTDTLQPHKPDAIFPNNWVSFHRDGTVVLYPMEAVNRRAERRSDLVRSLQREHGFTINRWLDLSHYEQDGHFLESTGSMVLDRTHRIVYAGLSSRTDQQLLDRFAAELGYEVIAFRGTDAQRQPIYHTNVMLCIGTTFAVICAEAIRDALERKVVLASLERTGHHVVPITLDQMKSFAGNMLELTAADDSRLIVLSARARDSLTGTQLKELERHGRLLSVPVATIEDAAGGSVRCMLAALHLPRDEAEA